MKPLLITTEGGQMRVLVIAIVFDLHFYDWRLCDDFKI